MPSANTNRNQIVVSVQSNVTRVNVRTTTVNAIAKAQGIKGADGTNGIGVPVGGTTGQVLSKIDSTNYNTTWTTPTGGGGSGDVVGPASASDNAIARFDTTTGKLIQNSGAFISDTTADITAGKYNTVAITGTASPIISVTGTTNISGTNTGDQNLSGYAPLASPALTGTPTAPTATVGTNTTQLATTAFTQAQIASNDALNVHLAGTETITGVKTFTPTPIFSSGATLTAGTTPSYSAGKLYFDSTTDALSFYNSDLNVNLQIGQEEWIRVVNNSGSTIANGASVYLSGASGSMPTIALAKADAAATTIGAGLATESIANGATGFVTWGGNVNGIDTSAFATGATVYVSATTAGALTSTAPVAPNYRYRIGIVGVSSATVGTVHVTPSTASLGNGSANQVFGMNAAGTLQEVKSILGTASQVTITNTANTITASLPATINVSTSGSAATLTTARTIGTLTGDATSAGSIFNGSANNTNAVVVGRINGVALSGLATGILKNTTTTGVPSIAVAGTDYQAPISLTTTGTSGAATFVSNVLNIPNYATSGGSPLTTKGDLFGFDTAGNRIPVGANNTVLTADSTTALGVKWAAAGGTGTVTTTSVVTANGFAGTVATATTTPAITLTTSVTGLIKGNGTAISAATAGTDYEVPLTFSTGLTRSTNTITVNTSQNIATLSNLISNGIVTTSGGAGTLSVTATTGSGSVVLATSPTLVSPALGTPSSVNLANGTGLPLTTGVIGQLGVVNGGTGTTTSTGTGSVVLSSSPTLVTPALGTPSALIATNVTGTASGLTAGNATTLATARLINGVSFNGSADITTPSGAVVRSVAQTTHGFAVGALVRWNGTLYVASQANSAANAGVTGVVTTVTNANAFILTTEGPITGLTGLTSGTQYFLDPTTAGAFTATEPSTVGQVSKPVFIADSTTTGIFHNYRGIVVSSAGTGTVTNTGGSLTANSVVIGAGTNDTKVLAGFTTNGNGVLQLGVTGSVVGGVQFSNATSGGYTLSPPTGALGLTVSTLPTGGGTLYSTSSGTITSLQLATSLTDETGTGVAVFATTPTLVTPVLGVATATSINKVTLTAPTTSSTLTLVDGSSLITAGAFAQTHTATATTNVTYPAGTSTLYGTGTGTISSAQLATSLSDETGSGVAVFGTGPTMTVPVIDQFGTASGLGAAWGTWAVTWTNVTIGNATVVARYKQIGKTVFCFISYAQGTTTSITGAISFSIPVTATANYNGTTTGRPMIGQVYLEDNGVQGYGPGFFQAMSTTTVGLGITNTTGTYAGNNNVSATVPFTWGTGDYFTGTFTYEAA